MWWRAALLVLAGGAAVHAAPISNPGATLTPAQIERGCTLDLIPWRRECQVVKNENITLKHVGDDPAPDPLFDVGCDWNEGAKIPHHCHIGDVEFKNPLPDIIDWFRGFPYDDGHHPKKPKHSHTPVPTTTTSPMPTSPVPTTTTSPMPTSHVPTTTSPVPTSQVPTSPVPTTTASSVPTTTEKPKHPSSTATPGPPTATPTQDPNKNMTDVIDSLHKKDDKALKIGLGVGLGVGIPAAGVAAWIAKTLSTGRGVHEIDAVMNELGDFGLGNLPEWTEFTEYSYSDLSSHYPTWDPPVGNDYIDGSHVGEPRPDQGGRVNDWLNDVEDDFTPREIESLDDLADEVIDAVDALENVADEAGLTTVQAYDLLRNLQPGNWQPGPAGSSGSSTSGTEGASSAMEWAENAVNNALGDASDTAGGAGNAPGGGGLDGGGSSNGGGSNGGGSNAAGGGSAATESFSAEMAAEVASSGAGAEAVVDALLQAGVPASNVASTLGAISNAIKALPNAGPSNAARNAALKVISKAITPQGAAVSKAASAVLGGATGETVADALREVGVPEDAVGSTVQAVNDAIEGARAAGQTGSKLMTAAINVIWRAFPPDSGEISSGGLPDPIGEISRALLNIVGASYNFWYVYPKAVYSSLQKLEGKKHRKHSKLSKTLAKILANGPPPEMGPSMDITFPFRRQRIRGYKVKVWPGEGGKVPSTSPSPTTSPSRPISKSPSPTGKGPDKATDTSSPAPPEPTKPAVPKVGHCENLTDAQLSLANSIEVSDDMYEYGSVNKTYLAEWLRNDPAAFNDLRTNGVPVSMCGIQTKLKSTPISEDERRQFNLVFSLLEQLESGLNQVSKGLDGLEPVPPATGEHRNLVFNHYWIRVPKLRLPSFGHMCPHLNDMPTWEKMIEDESTLQDVKSWEELVDDSVDFFKHHEYQYMLYMEVHLDELSAALEILEDVECYLHGFLERYPNNSERPGKPARHETLERVQAMLKRFRKIQVDPWKA